MSQQTPAGWHTDPDDSTQYRYWDGTTWTEHRSPKENSEAASSGAPVPPPPGTSGTKKTEKKAWWKRWWGIALIVLLLIVVVGSLGETADDTNPAAVSEDADGAADEQAEDIPEEAEDVNEVAGIGDPVSDGQFTFVVNGIECGATTIGEEPFDEEAQGQWCELSLTVENTGNEARSLSSSSQYLYDDQERRFDASVVFGADTPIYEQINPGNSIDGTIYFDVPASANPASVELHDSAFSSGVLVLLQ